MAYFREQNLNYYKTKFSIIIASYLGNYPGAATDREFKFFRSIHSVLSQRFPDWECIIVADGCTRTRELYEEHFIQEERIKLIEIPKEKLWSARVRNTGLDAAQGDWIIYLDTDDMLGDHHLEKIIRGMERLDEPVSWVYFNNYIAQNEVVDTYNYFKEQFAAIDQKGKCGTCNIAHRNQNDFRWNDNSYLHDWYFIKMLKLSSFYTRIPTPEYYVCHYPGVVDI